MVIWFSFIKTETELKAKKFGLPQSILSKNSKNFCAAICFPFVYSFFSPLVMIHFPSNDDVIHIEDIDGMGNFAADVAAVFLKRGGVIFFTSVDR